MRKVLSSLRREPGFWLIAALAAYWLTVYHFAFTKQFTLARLQELVAFEASSPFVYRVLMPWLASLLIDLGAPSPYMAFMILEVPVLCALTFATRALIAPYVPHRPTASLAAFLWIVPFLFNTVLPRNNAALYYPWDAAGLLVFTLGLQLLLRREWAAYYLVFVIGTLNRETTCFLTVLMLLTADGMPRRTLLAHAASQAGIWLVFKISLAIVFADAPGAGLHEMHFMENVHYLYDPWNWPLLASALGFLWAAALAGYTRWRGPEGERIRRACWVAAPYLAGMMIVANIGELRIYNELIPVAILASLGLLRTEP